MRKIYFRLDRKMSILLQEPIQTSIGLINDELYNSCYVNKIQLNILNQMKHIVDSFIELREDNPLYNVEEMLASNENNTIKQSFEFFENNLINHMDYEQFRLFIIEAELAFNEITSEEKIVLIDNSMEDYFNIITNLRGELVFNCIDERNDGYLTTENYFDLLDAMVSITHSLERVEMHRIRERLNDLDSFNLLIEEDEKYAILFHPFRNPDTLLISGDMEGIRQYAELLFELVDPNNFR